jgi:hypothetical protein
MTLNNGIDLLDGGKKSRKIDLTMVFERNLSENRQCLSKLRNIDLRGIAGDITFRLQLFHPHEAGTG